MADLIVWPFRVGASGTVVTADDYSVEYVAAELAQLALTNPGERRMVPDYGMTSPAFDELDEAELQIQVDIYGPPVEIDGVVYEEDDGDENTDTYTIAFTIQDRLADEAEEE